MVAAALLGLALSNALQAFRIILQVGAGTGLLFILRWFWWRINAFSEIAAMIASFVVAIGLEFFGPEDLSGWEKILVGVGITTVVWLLVTFVTRPTDYATLRRFCRLIHPGGPGWAAVLRRIAEEDDLCDEMSQPWTVPMELLCMAGGWAAVYSALFATGYWIYGEPVPAVVLTCVAAACVVLLFRTWRIVTDRKSG